MIAKRILTTGEIAKHCGVHFRTVIRWVERGHLKAYKLPGRGDHRVTIDDFLEFLKSNNMPIPKEFLPKSHRILIADDDIQMAKSIQRVLRRTGFETAIALDGFRAGAMLGSFFPSILTLDLKMPGAGGLEVIKFVRETKYLENLKILIISGLPKNKLNEAVTAGADDALAKPFKNTVLVEKIIQLTGEALLDTQK